MENGRGSIGKGAPARGDRMRMRALSVVISDKIDWSIVWDRLRSLRIVGDMIFSALLLYFSECKGLWGRDFSYRAAVLAVAGSRMGIGVIQYFPMNSKEILRMSRA